MDAEEKQTANKQTNQIIRVSITYTEELEGDCTRKVSMLSPQIRYVIALK